jgi:hypothetical protein
MRYCGSVRARIRISRKDVDPFSGTTPFVIRSIHVAGAPFPRNFEEEVVKVIFKRLFRVYAHIYHSHFQKIVSLKEEAHLNTCFKHFMYFTQHFNLIEKKELAPLQELIDSIT